MWPIKGYCIPPSPYQTSKTSIAVANERMGRGRGRGRRREGKGREGKGREGEGEGEFFRDYGEDVSHWNMRIVARMCC